ncbi:MAG: phosphatase PAP2 family protein [Novosphingobium sp.]
MNRRIGAVLLGLTAAAAAGLQAKQPETAAVVTAPVVSVLRAGGYLATPAPDDSILLSPPPPAAGSSAESRDIDGAKAALSVRGSPRWTLAQADADLAAPTATGAFSCAAGVAIGAATTPTLDRLLHRAMTDLGRSTGVIKRAYMRPRPFMVNGQPSCTPDAEAILRRDGSYPSGHSAIGYGLGLILAELRPQQAMALVARGRAFGDSRRICNVHWLSDIEEGRVSATAVVARLHAEPEFRSDMEAARKELAGVTAAPTKCDVEAAALAAPAGLAPR